jgi:hypothetical protein
MLDHENANPITPKHWNKGKLTGAKPVASTKTRLVDPNQAPGRGANTRLGDVQSGD